MNRLYLCCLSCEGKTLIPGSPFWCQRWGDEWLKVSPFVGDRGFIATWDMEGVCFLRLSLERLCISRGPRFLGTPLVSKGVLVAQSCLTLCDTVDCSPPGSSVHGDSPGKNTGVGCHALLQGIFPTQGSNPGLPHCWWILYCLSREGSPKILEWLVYPFSRGTCWPRGQLGVSCIGGRFFTNWATQEAPLCPWVGPNMGFKP